MEVQAFAFDNNAWAPVTPPEAAPPTPQRLRVATWNIWFGRLQWKRRLAELLEEVRQADADVIALQEVTHNTLPLLLECDWIRRDYQVTDVKGRSFRAYGVVLLSRWPLGDVRLLELSTEMDRHLLSADICTQTRRIRMATVHLESMLDRARTRGRQLKQIFPVLDDADDAVLMGDFNFCSTWPQENDRLDRRFVDVWPALHDSPGWTVDTDRNRMTYDDKKKEKSVRFDRILLRSRGDYWRPVSTELLGTVPRKTAFSSFHPSDHFGLIAEIAGPSPAAET